MANDSIGFAAVFADLVNNTTVDGNGRTPQSDIIVGVAMIIISVCCALAYAVILISMWRDKELIKMTSYKFMFVLGWCDAIQCLPHAITGMFTICQSTGAYRLAKMMGVLASPFYLGYAMLTVILSFNRFVQLAFPHFEHVLFSRTATLAWIGVVIGFIVFYMAALSSPWASNVYHPEWYSWSWDLNLPASLYLKKIAMVIEVGGIFISFLFYVGILIIIVRTRKRIASSRNFLTEVKILTQALTITVYCSVLNILWYNYQSILPDDLWTFTALNFMWILGSGVYPIIYLIVNGALRGKIVRAILDIQNIFTRTSSSVDRSKTNPTTTMRIHVKN